MYALFRIVNKGIISVFFIVLSFHLSAQNKTKNLIIVTLDGLRWQEVFTGADAKLLSQKKFSQDQKAKEKFWADSFNVRREKLMPFLWNTIGKQGQLYGNRLLGNKVNCSNPHWFSYPGYSEMLVGFVDKRVRSNDPIANPNTTILDYIQGQVGFEGRVATFATWDVIEKIASRKHHDFEVNAGDQQADGNISEGEELLNGLQELLPNPHGARYDAFTFYYAFEYLKRSCPRVMFISFDETDEHAHGERYDEYLNATHKTDKMISKLWNWLQSKADYKDQTTLIITTDHGRGAGRMWKDHGRLAFGSGQIWFAVIGPDTPAFGEMRAHQQYYQKQIASTMATFLGLNYTSSHKHVAPAVKSMISRFPLQANDKFVSKE